MDTTRAIQAAVARVDLLICQARASPWPVIVFCIMLTSLTIIIVRRCLK